jgi:SAM-dependent methyltransferase
MNVLREIYYTMFRVILRADCWLSDKLIMRGWQEAGIPPAMLRYRVSESLSISKFETIGMGCAAKAAGVFAESGVSFSKGAKILDFGCGCGRIFKWMRELFPECRFYGADTDGQAIEWCISQYPGCAFERLAPAPPTAYANGAFAAIYCFSVFTHLDELMQDQWLFELRRVLGDDGALLLTFHGKNAARELPTQMLQQLESEGVLHVRSRKHLGLMPDWYHTTWHTKSYITERLSRYFDDVRIYEIMDGAQDIAIATCPK